MGGGRKKEKEEEKKRKKKFGTTLEVGADRLSRNVSNELPSTLLF